MQKLPLSTVKLITSTQVITSIYSVVKELVENALDAAADSIDVRLENGGLDNIEIQDNGTGISAPDIEYLCKPHYTSKIKNESDLLSLSSYGFRGEAVHSLCTVAEISVTTKTKDDFVSQIYTFDKAGDVTGCKPSHHNIGTIFSVKNLFKDLPVRRQFYNKSKKLKEELNRVEELLMCYGLMHPKLRLTLANNKNVVWRKNRTSDYVYTHAISEIFGKTIRDGFTELDIVEENFELKLFVPKCDCNVEVMTRSQSDRLFIFVNERPVVLRELKLVLKRCFTAHCSVGSNRWPIAVVYIKVKPDLVDVNLEPNKTNVLLLNMEEIIEKIKSVLESLYDRSQPEEDLLLNEETAERSEPNTCTSTIDDVANVNVEETISNTGMVETNMQPSSELLDGFSGNEDLDDFISSEGSQLTCGDDELIFQDHEIPDVETPKATNHNTPQLKDSSGKDRNKIPRHNVPTQDSIDEPFSSNENLIENSFVQNENTSDSSQVGEFDLEQWSKGNTDLEICTPVRVLKPQNKGKEHSSKKRKQAAKGTPTTKKVKRNSSISQLLFKKESKEIGSDAEKGSNYDDEKCDVQFDRIKERFFNRKTASTASKTIHVVGKLHQSETLWFVVIGPKLFTVDYARLSEKLIYDKLLKNHKFKTEKLLHPVLLTRENLNPDNFEHLCGIQEDMPINDGVGRAILYPSFIDNGILVKRSQDSKSGEDVLEWTHGAIKIPNYNLSDLVEILQDTKMVATEEQIYRPTKVKDWCKKEAIRLSQVPHTACSPGLLAGRLLELKNISNQTDFEVEMCLHQHPIMVPLRSIDFL